MAVEEGEGQSKSKSIRSSLQKGELCHVLAHVGRAGSREGSIAASWGQVSVPDREPTELDMHSGTGLPTI